MNRHWLHELWSYRELFCFFVWRDIKVKYKQSLLGVGWAIVQPLSAMIIFSLFFGRLANVPSEGVPYPVFSYAGLLPWTYFSAAIALGANSLISNTNMINKVYFPRLALPISSVLSGVLDFFIAALLLLALMLFYHVRLTWWLLLMPVLLFVLILLTIGVSLFLAALYVRYRDVKYVLPFLIQLWLFATPVIYPVSLVPEQFQPLFALNPLAGIIDGFRSCVLSAKGFDLPLLGIALAITLIVFITGIVYFRRTERWFADII
jgi:lipopolysaccharide transport system permease protein